MYRRTGGAAGGKELDVLQPFCTDYRARFHVRQIAVLLKMNHATAALALKRLESRNILKFEQEGRNKKYFLNLDNPSAEQYLKNTENARTAMFLENNFIFKKMAGELAPVFRETPIMLFGSYAKGNYRKESDIDVLIIKDRNEKNIVKSLSEFGTRHGKTIQVQRMTQDSFEKGLRDRDTLVLEIVKNHVVLNNSDTIVNILWRYYNEIR